MTLENKLENVRALLVEHNDAVGTYQFIPTFDPDVEVDTTPITKPAAGYVDVDKFFSLLKAIGATSEDRLKSLSYEDILDILPAVEGIKPKLLAKAIAQVFRDKEETVNRPVSSVRAERMTLRELVENYDPEDAGNAVGKILDSKSKGQAFVVYSSGRIVDVEPTLKLLMECKQGFPGRTDYDVNGVIKVVYKLGCFPDNFADENPFYLNRPLRPDGTCDQTGRSWEGVSQDIREFVAVGVQIGEIKVTIENAHNILDIVVTANALNQLKQRYRKVAVEYQRLSDLGQLPRLKITLGSSAGPFQDGKKVVWSSWTNPEVPGNIPKQLLNSIAKKKQLNEQQWAGPFNNGYRAAIVCDNKFVK